MQTPRKPSSRPAQTLRGPGSGLRTGIILAVIGVCGLAALAALGWRRQREAAEAARLEAIAEAPVKNRSNISLTFFRAINDVLDAYCEGTKCINAKVREGADSSWELTPTPVSLRILLYSYLEKGTGAPRARLRLDFATVRDDGDITKDFPLMGQISDRLMQKLGFPRQFWRGTCAAPASVGGASFSCATQPYDVDFGPFDQNARAAVRLYKRQKTFTLIAPGPFSYTNGELRFGP